MKWRLVIPPPVVKVIKKLPPQTKGYVREALEDLRKDPWAGKALRDELLGFYSFRAKSFRIVYRIEKRTVTVLIVAVGHRKNVYEELTSHL